MEIQSRYSELSVILQVSAVEGCPLSGVPLYTHYHSYYRSKWLQCDSVQSDTCQIQPYFCFPRSFSDLRKINLVVDSNHHHFGCGFNCIWVVISEGVIIISWLELLPVLCCSRLRNTTERLVYQSIQIKWVKTTCIQYTWHFMYVSVHVYIIQCMLLDHSCNKYCNVIGYW